jgi:methyl-accepting chemotaxis protein
MQDRRKRYFIKSGFQTKFIISFCLLILVESIAIGVLLYFLINKGITESMYVSHFKIKTTGEIVAPIIYYVNIVAAAATVLSALVLSFFTISRIERSLVKFKEAAGKVKEGDLTVKLTHKYLDLTDELSNSFEGMLDGLCEKVKSMNSELNVIGDKVKTFSTVFKEDAFSHDQITSLSKSLSESINKLGMDINFFKLEGKK